LLKTILYRPSLLLRVSSILPIRGDRPPAIHNSKLEINTVMSDKRIDASVVVPLYNEEESVGILFEQLVAALDATRMVYEILFIDDGSEDRTWEIIEKLKKEHSLLRGIKFRTNHGQTSAMAAGFDHARGDIIITMDGDLQNDPRDIPRLLAKMSEGYDIVSGWRRKRQDHFSRVLPSKVANWIISRTTGVKLHDYGCSLKAYRTKCIKPLNVYGEMHRFLPALASMTGAKIAEIDTRHHERRYGVSKYGFDRIFKVFSDIFAMNLIIHFSSTPLKGFAMCAFPFSLMTLFFGMLSSLAVGFGWTEGKALFFFLTTVLSAMAVIQLITLGILGELVIRTSDLSHTSLPEITRRKLNKSSDGPWV
jgi:glycosyltransferase involved in cell wall biosynthesis